jgi:glycosyltransferase involved in cell wall biosynthesis
VSVVIAVFNGRRYIGDAIESVLSQTCDDLECIVVDDGSTDGTGDLISGFDDVRVRYIWQPNRGVSNARNRGIGMARAALIGFLDADDVWLPTKLAAQLEVIRRHPEAGLVFCGYSMVDEDLRVRDDVLPDRRHLDLNKWLMLEGNGIGISFTGVVPKRVIEAAGGFDETLSTSADLEFACRIAARYPVDAVDLPLALYRAHAGQMHLDLKAFESDMLRIYDDRFPSDSPRTRRLLRRAKANLSTRIFFYALRQGEVRLAARHLLEAVRARPDRVAVLPVAAIVRRSRRRFRTRRRLARSSGEACPQALRNRSADTSG